MKIDQNFTGSSALVSEKLALDAEASGFDGVWATESVTDPFVQSYGMVRSTSHVQVGTGIAVAFARNPMTAAYSSWELANASQGRFVLGLGTQVKAHIERRYSMTWSEPARRLEEFVHAVRSIWDCWRDGSALAYEGEFYRHTLMAPMFTPPHHSFDIPVVISAVGPKMMSLAGSVCDGVLLHPLTNIPYLDGTALPSIAAGREHSGREGNFSVSCSAFMIIGDNDEQLEAMRTKVRSRIAFYASTPAYRNIMGAIGYEGLHEELRVLARKQQWEQLVELIDDEVVRHFAIEGKPEEIPQLAHQRFGGRLDRISSYFGWPIDDPDRLRQISAQFASLETDAA